MSKTYFDPMAKNYKSIFKINTPNVSSYSFGWKTNSEWLVDKSHQDLIIRSFTMNLTDIYKDIVSKKSQIMENGLKITNEWVARDFGDGKIQYLHVHKKTWPYHVYSRKLTCMSCSKKVPDGVRLIAEIKKLDG